jgi:hypothetical protein
MKKQPFEDEDKAKSSEDLPRLIRFKPTLFISFLLDEYTQK